MKIAVVGLGGVGGYLAASFVRAGFDVTGFGRGAHLQAIQKEGLRIVEDTQEWQVALEAKELREAGGVYDLVLFCVKSYDLREAYEAVSGHVSKESVLISFANGVNNGDTLRELSDARVVDGVIYILSHIEKAGVIRKKGKVFAAVFGAADSDAVALLADVFEKSQLRYKTPDDIQTALWKKYIFIAAFATLTSYYDTSIGVVHEKHYDEAKELLEEIAAFAQETKGIDIFDEVQKSLDTAAKVPYDSSTSMHKDFTNHKKVELENLSGYVQKPLMKKLYNELKKRSVV